MLSTRNGRKGTGCDAKWIKVVQLRVRWTLSVQTPTKVQMFGWLKDAITWSSKSCCIMLRRFVHSDVKRYEIILRRPAHASFRSSYSWTLRSPFMSLSPRMPAWYDVSYLSLSLSCYRHLDYALSCLEFTVQIDRWSPCSLVCGWFSSSYPFWLVGLSVWTCSSLAGPSLHVSCNCELASPWLPPSGFFEPGRRYCLTPLAN